MPSAFGLAAAGAALLLVSAVPAASAAGLHLAIEGRDTACPSGHTFCFVVTQGSLSDLKAGASGTITFTNRGQANHEIHLVALGDADPAHTATDEAKSFAGSRNDMPAGASATFNFTVPASATGVYLFCGVPGHEQAGMWLDSTAASPTKGTPVPWTLAPLALATALLVRRRQARWAQP